MVLSSSIAGTGQYIQAILLLVSTPGGGVGGGHITLQGNGASLFSPRVVQDTMILICLTLKH